MSIAQRLVNLSDGLSAEGILSAAKGGTGTTTGAGSSTPTISAIGYGGDDTATNPAGGATITLTGTNFASGAQGLINLSQVSFLLQFRVMSNHCRLNQLVLPPLQIIVQEK